MSSLGSFTTVIVLLSVLYFAAAPLSRAWYRSRRLKDFPPGPRTIPILGNLHLIPTTKSFLKFHEWGKQYGSIVGLKLGPQNLVILNDYKHVLELFDRRGAIYSDRPPNHIATDILFPDETHMLFMRYGPSWRKLRRTVQDLLRTSEVDKILPIQNAESVQTLHHILHDSQQWYDHIRRYSSAVILASVFGLRGTTFDSPRVKALYHVQDQNTAINELGATPPIDIFPILKYLPDCLSPWRKWARSIRAEYQEFLVNLVAECKENAKRPGAPDCFLMKMLREQEQSNLDEEHIAHLGTTLMEAGSDTTASTLLSFLLAMATHPYSLRKCQDEVDAICGTRRSPSIEDLEHLTYVKAVMNETLRWRPVAAGGVPHTLMQDDVYEGFSFPRGTMFFANTWSIHRTSEYSQPDDFIPERWLESPYGSNRPLTTEGSSGDGKRRVQYGFGAGRRVCSGQRLAENSLMINIAKLVWAFNLASSEPLLDQSVATAYFGGFLICPKRFPIQMTVRSKAHADTIETELEALQPFLDTFGV